MTDDPLKRAHNVLVGVAIDCHLTVIELRDHRRLKTHEAKMARIVAVARLRQAGFSARATADVLGLGERSIDSLLRWGAPYVTDKALKRQVEAIIDANRKDASKRRLIAEHKRRAAL